MKISVIEVAEYVLPKFEVKIDSPDHFTLDDEKVQAVIRAKYTHGKPLRGTAVVTVTGEDNFGTFYLRRIRRMSYASNQNRSEHSVKKTVAIDGQETIEFNIKDELKFDRSDKNKYCDLQNFKIEVEVTETLTGLSQTAVKTVKVHKDSYKITTDLSHSFGAIQQDNPVDVTVCTN